MRLRLADCVDGSRACDMAGDIDIDSSSSSDGDAFRFREDEGVAADTIFERLDMVAC